MVNGPEGDRFVRSGAGDGPGWHRAVLKTTSPPSICGATWHVDRIGDGNTRPYDQPRPTYILQFRNLRLYHDGIASASDVYHVASEVGSRVRCPRCMKTRAGFSDGLLDSVDYQTTTDTTSNKV